MRVFAIETSCDETSTAIVDIPTRHVLALTIYSQYAEHAPYGGVVPEIASRAHLERLPALTTDALTQSGLEWADIDAIAATVGPGLTTALVIGSTFAQTLAVSLNKPFWGANHIEGHALSPLLALPNTQTPALTFPYLLLLLTGGHCQFVAVEGPGRYTTLGTTFDDAVGECFDKVAKILGFPHPGGPAIEACATSGHSGIPLPMPKNDTSLDFSFSGLKTAVKDLMAKPNPPPAADVAASFQTTVATLLAKKLGHALMQTGYTQAVIAGGVAVNQTIRAALQATCQAHGATFTAPPLKLCADNAAMIAFAAGLRAQAGLANSPLGTRPIPRWPLDAMSTSQS